MKNNEITYQGPAYSFIKRKRIPRGVERLRDRRWPRRTDPAVLAQVVQHAATPPEGNAGNEGSAERRIVGKPFAPKPK
jgi:hypothetical protein